MSGTTNTNGKIITSREKTAAWQDIDHKEGQAKVPIPTKTGVIEAKDWVENGSKL